MLNPLIDQHTIEAIEQSEGKITIAWGAASVPMNARHLSSMIQCLDLSEIWFGDDLIAEPMDDKQVDMREANLRGADLSSTCLNDDSSQAKEGE